MLCGKFTLSFHFVSVPVPIGWTGERWENRHGGGMEKKSMRVRAICHSVLSCVELSCGNTEKADGTFQRLKAKSNTGTRHGWRRKGQLRSWIPNTESFITSCTRNPYQLKLLYTTQVYQCYFVFCSYMRIPTVNSEGKQRDKKRSVQIQVQWNHNNWNKHNTAT
jgi:hypothetical protein